MALKLLSQSEASTRSKKSLESEKYRLTEVQTLITQKYKELSQAEQDFADALLNQQDIWAAHLTKFEEKRDKLKAEVEELEERRAQALIPLTEREKMLDTKASALAQKEETLTKKESDLEEKDTLLTVKLDEVAERELQADKLAKTLTQKEEGIQLQATAVQHGQETLGIATTSLATQVKEADHGIALKWAAVNAREQSLITREAKVAQAEAGFAARERAIQDKYATLERATKQHDNNQSTARGTL